MSADVRPGSIACNCLAIRQAARHVTQHYDQYLASAGLRTTQYSILTMLRVRGPMTINALAQAMVMDRTTLGRNILPLQRRRLIAVEKGHTDRRSKLLRLTDIGAAQLGAAREGWSKAQASFDDAFGSQRAADLRALLKIVVSTDFAAAPAGAL
jgi:DNA-binding MarR family transcriptional regulator